MDTLLPWCEMARILELAVRLRLIKMSSKLSGLPSSNAWKNSWNPPYINNRVSYTRFSSKLTGHGSSEVIMLDPPSVSWSNKPLVFPKGQSVMSTEGDILGSRRQKLGKTVSQHGVQSSPEQILVEWLRTLTVKEKAALVIVNSWRLHWSRRSKLRRVMACS